MKKLLLPIALLAAISGFSQYEFYNKGADVYTQKGALIHVQGTLVNDDGGGSGAINNDGIIEVKGDIENQTGAEFKVGADATSLNRAVKFVGSGTQAIKGSFNTICTASFQNLVIDKTAATDAVEMQTNVTVEGSIVFSNSTTTSTYNPTVAGTTNNTKGLLRTYSGATEYLLHLENSAFDAVKGYPSLVMNGNPNTGYILTLGTQGSSAGGFERKVTSGGNTDFVFPIGTTTNGYNASELNFGVTGGAMVTGNVKAKFCDNTGYVGNIPEMIPQNPPYGTDNTGYNRYFWTNPCNGNQPQWVILENGIKDHGYWSFESSVPGYTYSMEVFPNNFVYDGGLGETWRVVKYSDSYGSSTVASNTTDWGAQIESSMLSLNDLLTYTLNTGCYSGAGIPGGRFTNFSHFMMSKAKSANGLPVELIYLDANAVNNEFIQVTWATSLEINNDGFEVQRSTDGLNWTNIGWVDGHDNSNVTNTYSFDDRQVAANVVYYYRLRQVDNDGQSELTHTVSAEIIGAGSFTISEFIPNPTKDFSQLIINTSSNQTVNVKLYDLLGQVISDRDFNLTPGQNQVPFETQLLAGGNYTAAITSANKTFTKRLTITR